MKNDANNRKPINDNDIPDILSSNDITLKKVGILQELKIFIN